MEDVVRDASLLPLRHRETGLKVDMALGPTGFEQQVIRRGTAESLGGVAIRVATSEDLLLMKTLAGRPRDDEDARGIVLRRGEEIDWDYAIETGRQLEQVTDQDIVSRLLALRRATKG